MQKSIAGSRGSPRAAGLRFGANQENEEEYP